jgi:3-hydroxyisobutyrate dehydrogenase
MEHIGFIGLGNIGTPMAMCLIRAGLRLTACDKRPGALEKFRALGVKVTGKPSDCAGTEMVIIMVGDDSQVEETLLGPEGLLKSVNTDKPPFLAIMSTVLPGTIKRLAGPCGDRNVRLMDAPVSGMPVAAEQGRLTIMAGGEKADLDAMRPVFESMGNNIYHTGPLGTGNVTKLVNNIIGLTSFFVSSEAFEIGQRLGMDPQALASIFENSTGRKTFGVFSQSPEVCRVTVNLARKDLEHAQELAREAGVPCTFFDHIVEGIDSLPYEEIYEKWVALTK